MQPSLDCKLRHAPCRCGYPPVCSCVCVVRTAAVLTNAHAPAQASSPAMAHVPDASPSGVPARPAPPVADAACDTVSTQVQPKPVKRARAESDDAGGSAAHARKDEEPRRSFADWVSNLEYDSNPPGMEPILNNTTARDVIAAAQHATEGLDACFSIYLDAVHDALFDGDEVYRWFVERLDTYPHLLAPAAVHKWQLTTSRAKPRAFAEGDQRTPHSFAIVDALSALDATPAYLHHTCWCVLLHASCAHSSPSSSWVADSRVSAA
jgi:hypothetical protein